MTAALILALGAALAFAVLWWRSAQRSSTLEQQLRALESASRISSERLQRLEVENTTHRLNPHLFKNTLNTVQFFSYRTNWALERLGRLFDFMLYDSQTGAVSLEEELNFLQDLIELNKLRLGPLFDFRIRMDVDRNDRLYRERLIAPLITAPFVENAFKHGDLDSDHGFIHIEVHLLDGRLHYEVVNRSRDAEEGAKRRGGLGKTALAQRMQAMYPGHHELNYSHEGPGHRASMTIDLEVTHAALHTA